MTPYESTVVLQTFHALGLVQGRRGQVDMPVVIRGMMHTLGDYALADVALTVGARYSLWEFKRDAEDVDEEAAKSARKILLARLQQHDDPTTRLRRIGRRCHWLGHGTGRRPQDWALAFLPYLARLLPLPPGEDPVLPLPLMSFCCRVLGIAEAGDPAAPRIEKARSESRSTAASLAALSKIAGVDAQAAALGVSQSDFQEYAEVLVAACQTAEDAPAKGGTRAPRNIGSAVGDISGVVSAVTTDGVVSAYSVSGWQELRALVKRWRPPEQELQQPGRKPPPQTPRRTPGR